MNINHNHILSLLQTGFTTIAVTFDYNADADTDYAKAIDKLIRQHLPASMELYDKYRRLL